MLPQLLRVPESDLTDRARQPLRSPLLVRIPITATTTAAPLPVVHLHVYREGVLLLEDPLADVALEVRSEVLLVVQPDVRVEGVAPAEAGRAILARMLLLLLLLLDDEVELLVLVVCLLRVELDVALAATRWHYRCVHVSVLLQNVDLKQMFGLIFFYNKIEIFG